MPKGVASDRNRDLTTSGRTSYQALRIHISARSTASILPGRNPAPAPLLAFIPPRAKFLRRSLGFHPISADEFTHHSFVQYLSLMVSHTRYIPRRRDSAPFHESTIFTLWEYNECMRLRWWLLLRLNGKLSYPLTIGPINIYM